jgi:hypothetical protein
VSRVLSALFLIESLLAALYLSQLISALPGHDADVIAVILLRGVVGALQFTAGWLLAARRPAGTFVARLAVVSAALWILIAVGFNRAPTDVYEWFRWQATAAYGLYAAALLLALNHLSKRR